MARTIKAQARQAWMRDVEDGITRIVPEAAGRIDWDTLTYFYLSGVGVNTAIIRYVAAHYPDVYRYGMDGSR